MVDKIYAGQDVRAQYLPLEPTKQVVACMIACSRLASELDQIEVGHELPPSVKNMGKFLSTVSHENVLVAVRSQVQIDRLVKFSLDEQPEWNSVLSHVNKEIDQ